METALIYNGSPIGERDEMLCLTDMWRASGCDDGKRPYEWGRQVAAEEFSEYIATNTGVARNELFQVVRGGSNPATWAHWQVGMAYAKYLSPEFHAWCNEVVRAHMEGRGLPVQAVQGAITISPADLERFAEKVGYGAVRAAREFLTEDVKRTVEPRFDRIENTMASNHQEVDDRLRLLEGQRNKKKASDSTLAQLNWVNFTLGGRCPCCGVNSVCNPDSTRAEKTHFDHFTQVDSPTPENSWITCRDCNTLKLPKQRSECRPAFDSFQKRRRDLVDRQSTPLLFWRRSS